jgi:hypothetical protein
VSNLGRIFDVSKPWLNRVIERLPHRLLVAAAEVSFAIAERELSRWSANPARANRPSPRWWSGWSRRPPAR